MCSYIYCKCFCLIIMIAIFNQKRFDILLAPKNNHKICFIIIFPPLICASCITLVCKNIFTRKLWIIFPGWYDCGRSWTAFKILTVSLFQYPEEITCTSLKGVEFSHFKWALFLVLTLRVLIYKAPILGMTSPEGVKIQSTTPTFPVIVSIALTVRASPC